MLRWRLTLGTLIVALLAGLCWLDLQATVPGIWLFPVALLLGLLAAGEMVSLGRARDLRVNAAVVYLATLLVVASNGVVLLAKNYPADCPVGKLGWPLIAMMAGLLLIVLAEMWRYQQPGEVTNRLAYSLFCVAYVAVPLSFAVQLRIFGEGAVGWVAVVSMIAVVKMSDIGAYTVGRLIGRRKLALRLSPGKTWEGLAGGIAFAVLTSYLCFVWLLPALAQQSPAEPARFSWGWVAYGVAIALAGVLGDLTESLLKRDAGRKDSSTWMPGFGGVLDLLDSILAAAPVAYLFWVAKIVG